MTQANSDLLFKAMSNKLSTIATKVEMINCKMIEIGEYINNKKSDLKIAIISVQTLHSNLLCSDACRKFAREHFESELFWHSILWSDKT